MQEKLLDENVFDLSSHLSYSRRVDQFLLPLLYRERVLQEQVPGLQGSLSREFASHARAYVEGRESILDYPYLRTLFELISLRGEKKFFRGWEKALMHLVELGADFKGMDARLWGAFVWDKQCFSRFIELGADIEACYIGQTPLHMAAARGWTAICRKLIDAGADIQSVGSNGAPFYCAARGGHVQVCMELLQAGASPRLWSSLHAAALLGQEGETERLLAEGAYPSAEDEDGCTPLHYAADQGYVPIVRALLAAGADPTGKHELTPLHRAVRKGRLEVCRALIDAGADMEAVYAGMTPLLLAAQKMYDHSLKDSPAKGESEPFYEICRELLQGGADVRAVDILHNTPLHWAAMCGGMQAALFIETGQTDPNAVDWQGRTPLHYAAESKREALYDYLLSHGADASIRDLKGLTPLDIWENKQPDDRVNFLGRLRADDVLHEKARHDEHARLMRELERHYKLYLAEKENINAFPYIAHLLRIGNVGGRWISAKYVQELIDRGADVNAPLMPERATPLHEIMIGDNVQICRVLLAAGADVHALNAKGQTPLHMAALQVNTTVYAQLAAAGADEYLPDDEGCTPQEILQRMIAEYGEDI